MAALEPFADDIRSIVQDETKRNVARESWKALSDMEQRRKPPVPDEIRPVYEKVSKLEEFADTLMAERKAAAEAPQREWEQRWQAWQNDPSNNRFYERLKHDHPDIGTPELQYLAQKAASDNFAPLEEVWKKYETRFVAPKPAAPPTSLRSDAGDIGIPAPSNGSQAKTLRERTIELETARRAGV